jgi:hypothetical protein
LKKGIGVPKYENYEDKGGKYNKPPSKISFV